MTDPFRVLDELETELARVVSDSHTQRHSTRRTGAGRLAPLAAAGAFLLATTTVTLAATGVILTGTPVPAPSTPGPEAGIGVPIPGQAKLLGIRAENPGGGLPWGIRVVPTTRGLMCVQIGRVQNGQLGELGVDGAFNNDGRFHPFGPVVVSVFPGSAAEGGAVTERGTCVLAESQGNGSAVTAEFLRASENAAFALEPSIPPAHPVDVSYGILGPRAVSVSYRDHQTTRSQQVLPGLGAYLIVQPSGRGATHAERGEAPGATNPGEGPHATGAVQIITYESNGKICEDGYNARFGSNVSIEHPCPEPSPYATSARITAPGTFIRQPHTTLRATNGKVLAADVSFAAPFPVANAGEGYLLRAKPCGPHEEGPGIAVLDRNVTQGATVDLDLPYPFQARCSNGAISMEVIYESSGREAKTTPGMAPGQLVVATTTVRLPSGERAAGPPRRFAP